ncbi:hypothetical protein HDU98_010477, partial [Podochytrium sp. JEL0797]
MHTLPSNLAICKSSSALGINKKGPRSDSATKSMFGLVAGPPILPTKPRLNKFTELVAPASPVPWFIKDHKESDILDSEVPELDSEASSPDDPDPRGRGHALDNTRQSPTRSRESSAQRISASRENKPPGNHPVVKSQYSFKDIIASVSKNNSDANLNPLESQESGFEYKTAKRLLKLDSTLMNKDDMHRYLDEAITPIEKRLFESSESMYLMDSLLLELHKTPAGPASDVVPNAKQEDPLPEAKSKPAGMGSIVSDALKVLVSTSVVVAVGCFVFGALTASKGSKKSLSLEIPRFSTHSDESVVVSYGANPFLVCGRKWGLNVYPTGHADSRTTRVEVYVHVYARNERETEAEFLHWLESKKLHFNLTLSEPAPQALHVSYSSHRHWSDMEDGAGWWYFSLDTPAPLLALTNDTLLVSLDFDESTTTLLSPLPHLSLHQRRMSKDGPVVLNPVSLMNRDRGSAVPPNIANRELSVPLFPAAAGCDPALAVLFDNPAFSDYTFLVDDGAISPTTREIHVQKCFVQAKLPDWHPTPQSYQEHVTDILYTSLHSFLTFLYSGRLPLLESPLPLDPTALAHIHILSEQYGHKDLQRFISRYFYSSVSAGPPHAAVELLVQLGGRSDAVQEMLVFLVCKNFAGVRGSTAFKELIEG